MTKKDYVMLAKVIRNLDWAREGKGQLVIEELVTKLVPELQADNPNFNANRFREACGLG